MTSEKREDHIKQQSRLWMGCRLIVVFKRTMLASGKAMELPISQLSKSMGTERFRSHQGSDGVPGWTCASG